MSLKERWAQAGLVAFRLPSGFIVSGVPPTESDLIRRGLMPSELRAALAKNKPGTFLRSLDDKQQGAVYEMRLRTAAAFLRGIYDDETGEWEAISLTFDELEAGAFPADDRQALDTFVAVIQGGVEAQRAAESITTLSEQTLGLRQATDDDVPAGEAEAEETVDAFAAFRDEPRGLALREDGPGVADEAIGDDRDPEPVSRPRRRRRAVPAAADGAGDQPAPPA